MSDSIVTASDLTFNGYSSTLVRYDNGEAALWVTDEYLAGRSDERGVYTLNDTNESVPLDPSEDIDAAVAAWKAAVDWEAGTL